MSCGFLLRVAPVHSTCTHSPGDPGPVARVQRGKHSWYGMIESRRYPSARGKHFVPSLHDALEYCSLSNPCHPSCSPDTIFCYRHPVRSQHSHIVRDRLQVSTRARAQLTYSGSLVAEIACNHPVSTVRARHDERHTDSQQTSHPVPERKAV